MGMNLASTCARASPPLMPTAVECMWRGAAADCRCRSMEANTSRARAWVVV